MEYKHGLKIGDLVPRFPLIQGGMGVGVSLSGLAGAVAAAGGIGIISTAQIGFRDKEFDRDPLRANLKAIGEELARARELAAGGIVGFNIMAATRCYEKYVREAAARGADLIISGAGLPLRLPEFVEGARTKIAPIVSSVKSASVICRMWDRKYHRAPDLVVIEGPAAGGHLGFSRQEAQELTRESYAGEIVGIIRKVGEYARKYGRKIPVAVAGGIFGRKEMEEVMALGADGVQVATRFVTTRECDAPDSYKQVYLQATEEDIVLTDSPVGMPGRAVRNPFLRQVQDGAVQKLGVCRRCLEKCARPDIPYCISQALINAVTDRVDQGLVFCGANAWRCSRMETVQEVFDSFFPRTG